MFSLNPVSGVPIYRQIVEQTRLLVATDQLTPGTRLPSVRAIASELSINPMTVSKAYSLLERAGIVERRRGVGMVVADAGLDASEAIASEAEALIETAKKLGMSRTDLLAQINDFWEKS